MRFSTSIVSTRKFWNEWGEVFALLAGIAVTSILAWQFPGKQQLYFNAFLFALGLMFDAYSASCYTIGLVTRKHISGFPFVGLVFYVWSWLSFPSSVLLSPPSDLTPLWLSKLADLIALVGLHLLFHLPFAFLHRFFPFRTSTEDSEGH